MMDTSLWSPWFFAAPVSSFAGALSAAVPVLPMALQCCVGPLDQAAMRAKCVIVVGVF